MTIAKYRKAAYELARGHKDSRITEFKDNGAQFVIYENDKWIEY
jgi:hypothetical protein